MYKEVPPEPLIRHGGARELIEELFKQCKPSNKENLMKETVQLCRTKKLDYGDTIDFKYEFAPYSEDLKRINMDAEMLIEPLQLFQYFTKANRDQILTYNYLFHKWANEYNYTPIKRLRNCIHAYYMIHGQFRKFENPEIRPEHTLCELMFSSIKPYNQTNDKCGPRVTIDFLTTEINKAIKFQSPSQLLDSNQYCEFIEEYDTNTMVQMINRAYNDCPFYEYKFVAPHDVILLKFRFGNIPIENVYHYCSIRTPVCFRDFCGFIINSEIDWLVVQENEFWQQNEDENLEKMKSFEEAYVFDEMDFIRPGSLKEQEMMASSPEKSASPRGKKNKNSMFFFNSCQKFFRVFKGVFFLN